MPNLLTNETDNNQENIDSVEKEELVKNDKEVKEPENKHDFVLYGGDTGKKVKILQFGIGSNVDGIYGKKTQKALDAYRTDYGFEKFNNQDRVSAMEYDSIKSSIEDMKHIKVARSYVGEIKEEDVDGDGDPDNRSPQIDKMTKYVFEWFDPNDNEEGYPWCAIFISYVMKSAYNSWDYKSATVKDWIEMMDNNNQINEISDVKELSNNRCYIGGWVNESGKGHIFFVDPYKSILINDSDIIATIEGNTNDGGSREGNGVYERQRYFTKNNKIRVFGIKV